MSPLGSEWARVPPEQKREFAERFVVGIPMLAEDILREIQREYPRISANPVDRGEPVALTAIRGALEHFVQQVTSDSDRDRAHPRVFQELGRGQLQHGRSLDSLQGMYRLGVRLAWRRLAEIGQQIHIPAPAMYELAETGFEYLDGLVAQSMLGYAEAAAREAGERLRLQRRLLEVLLGEPARPDSADAVAERAARIGWPLPERVAVAVLLRPARDALAPPVSQDVLLDMESERPRMVVPDPESPGRAELLRRTTAGWSGALGPSVPLAEAATSLRWATVAVGLMERGLLPSGEVLDCSEHTEALVLLPPWELIDALARRRLAPLAECGPTHGRRLAETLLAWLETRGGAPEVAAQLGVHPQTVRYRLRQIRELWGEELADPATRFELEVVLRAQRLRGGFGAEGGGGPEELGPAGPGPLRPGTDGRPQG
ncbi:helix-turn-helix domain-containing protein [Streptomyces sp. NPDC018031]|uniref:PucR family transcriptional regulator n=1 Tax=Streptomyces sp. NPDC018031 TaxID=3365033 RepID=UPI0037BA4D5A